MVDSHAASSQGLKALKASLLAKKQQLIEVSLFQHADLVVVITVVKPCLFFKLRPLVHEGGGGDDIAHGDWTMPLMVVVVHAKS